MIRWICIEDSWLDPSFICWNHISLLLKRLSPSKNIPRNSLFLTISKVMILSSFCQKERFLLTSVPTMLKMHSVMRRFLVFDPMRLSARAIYNIFMHT